MHKARKLGDFFCPAIMGRMINFVKHLGDNNATLKMCSACLLNTHILSLSDGIEGGITDFSLGSLSIFSICLSKGNTTLKSEPLAAFLTQSLLYRNCEPWASSVVLLVSGCNIQKHISLRSVFRGLLLYWYLQQTYLLHYTGEN